MNKPAEFEAALKAALNLLRTRDYFEARLKERLLSKGFSDQVVSLVISDLKERRLLSDERLLDHVIGQKEQSRQVGKRRVLNDLIRHGADAAETARRLADIPDESDIVIAVNLLKKRYSYQEPIAKMARFLANRGFGEDTIRSALEELGYSLESE